MTNKKFDNQLMNFEITEDKLKMEIDIKDLVWLFEYSPHNCYDEEIAKVKEDKHKEFVEFIVKQLMDESRYDENNTLWGLGFEEAFMRIFEGYEDDFITYPEDK